MYIKVVFKIFYFSFVDVNVMLDKFSTDNCYGKKLYKVHIFSKNFAKQKKKLFFSKLFCFVKHNRSLLHFRLNPKEYPYQYVTAN